MNYIDLGRRVRQLRKDMHITQEELAERVDISASFLGHIERGTRIASLETLVKLCRALNTHPNHLLAFTGDQAASPFPADMPEATRAQLAELFYQGCRVLQGNIK